MARARMLVASIAVAAALAAAPATTRFSVRTNNFTDGGPIPARFTCDGTDESPSLEWTDPPVATRSMAIVVDDPDAPGGTFTHWMVWGIPPGPLGIPEAVNKHREELGEARQGTNDFGKHGWGGPCPPKGKAHHYVIRILALSAPLDLPAESGRKAFDVALGRVRVLATATLTGTYQRP